VEIGDYVRAQRRHLLVVEVVTLALFAFDLLIRLGNPDLWHPAFGGEKPMVFSFFNAVLKSTYFPPYDPWLAGGYINYYYYGFVIVGLLPKLLGIVPSFAYNLILPMLFSLLGVNAFCVAYNLVGGRKPEVRSQKLEAEGQKLEVGSRESEVRSQKSEVGNPGREVQVSKVGVEMATLEFHEETLAETSSDLRPPTSHLQPPIPNAYLAGIAAALLIVVLGSLGQVWFIGRGLRDAADHAALANSPLGDNDFTATLNGLMRVATGKASLPGGGRWYWDATRIVTYTASERGQGGGNEINEFPFFTFLYADLHAHMMDLPFTVLALAWGVSYVLAAKHARTRLESVVVWLVGGLAFGVTRAANTWDFPTYVALGLAAILSGQWVRGTDAPWRVSARDNLFALAGRLALFGGLVVALYWPFDQWFVSPYSDLVLWKGSKTPVDSYLYMYGLFLFILVTFLVWEARRWLAETPAAVLTTAGEWLPPLALAVTAFLVVVGAFLYLKIEIATLALPLMAWAGLLFLRARARMPEAKRVVLFLMGTALAITVFLDVYAVGGDRMNTSFKLGMQVWTLLSVAAGAALAWVWAERPGWTPNWQTAWAGALVILFGSAALYTVTAASAKVRDRFPSYVAQPNATLNPSCQELAGVPMPYPDNRSLPVDKQPHSLNGLDYLQWGAYCDQTYFLPFAYDYEAIRWVQDNVPGSPVIVEGQTFNLYKMSSRYAWNTGLPDVVGWDWHQRQERGALPTAFITERGREIQAFYCGSEQLTPDQLSLYENCREGLVYADQGLGLGWAMDFLRKYDVRYIVVGPMERAYYPPEGLAKFDQLAAQGLLSVAHRNPGVTIYEVRAPAPGQ
jgi:YYY domain-containing protein